MSRKFIQAIQINYNNLIRLKIQRCNIYNIQCSLHKNSALFYALLHSSKIYLFIYLFFALINVIFHRLNNPINLTGLFFDMTDPDWIGPVCNGSGKAVVICRLLYSSLYERLVSLKFEFFNYIF